MNGNSSVRAAAAAVSSVRDHRRRSPWLLEGGGGRWLEDSFEYGRKVVEFEGNGNVDLGIRGKWMMTKSEG